MNVLAGIEPKKVFDFFELISSVPHGSGNTNEVSSLCVEVAKNRGMTVVKDKLNNVVIYKEATKGYENVPQVIIQGHLDMVCAKDSSCKLDMSREPIKLRHDDKYVYADGTTLGGDDGIALAYGLALIDSKDIKHPALEIVFTSDEEIGMDGARGINGKLLSGRMLLNIDSEEEGVFTCGCAGGCRVNGSIPVGRLSLREICQDKNGCIDEYVCLSLTLSGLKGGHSGAEIDKQLASANYLLGRVLFELFRTHKFYIAELSGGEFDNVISEKASAKILIKKEIQNKVMAFLNEYDKELRAEYSSINPDLKLECFVNELTCDCSLDCIDEKATENILRLIYLSYQGVIEMDPELKGMVRTSQNLGVIKLKDRSFEIGFLVRSSVDGQKDTAVKRLRALIELSGGIVRLQGNYPGWRFKKDSRLRENCIRSFEKIYGHQPIVNTIHAGLECGLFIDKLDGLDAISFGPNILDIHTPKERLDIESVGRVWRMLLDILENMK